MKNIDEAIELSKLMNKIAKLANLKSVCVITNMDEPLGKCIGNSLEIMEAIEALKGNMQEDVKEVVLELGAQIIKLAGKGNNIEKNKKLLLENIQNGNGYNKLIELVKAQGGDVEYIKDLSKFEKAKFIIPVLAEEAGIIQRIDAEICGSISNFLGAGRRRKEDVIDPAVGIILNKKTGDEVKVGEILAYVNVNDEKKARSAVENLKKAFEISKKRSKKSSNIIAVI